MGYSGKLAEKQKARELRQKGFSYKEIQASISVSKSTLSLWCRDILLTPSQIERLTQKRLQGAALGRFRGAKIQQQRRLIQTKNLLNKGKKEVGNLSKRDRFIAGICLYAADGDKTDGKLGFTNSNPQLIKFMVGWFREFCKVKEAKLRGSLWIHDDLDPKRAQRFWSELTKIPPSQFHKPYIAQNKPNSRKIRKKKHQYGIFSIRFSDTQLHRLIMGWISGIVD